MIPDSSAYKKSSFGPAFLFLGSKQRKALAGYYAFCRLMDDIADELTVQNPQQELDFWHEEIDRVFKKQATTALGEQLQDIVTQFNMTPDRFLWLIEGMQADLRGRSYHSFEELEWYLWRVAAIVGLATLDILGVKGPKAQELARALGFAVQLTNIIRDVHEDASRGRIYLPTELLARFGVNQQDVLNKRHLQKQARALAALAAQAKLFYAQAEEKMNTLPPRKIFPCRVMSLVYRANLAKIEKMDFRFDKAVKLSKSEKIGYVIYALFKTPVFG